METQPRQTPNERAWPWPPLLALLVLAALVLHRLVALHPVDDAWFAQNDHNLLFAQQPTLSGALAWSQKTWPPLYPVLLWSWARTGLPLVLLNELLWIGVLALLVHLGRRHLRHVHPGWLLAAATLLGPHALIVAQRTSEALFVLCALFALERALALLATPPDDARARRRHVVLLGLAAAAAGLSRYFGVLWLFPALGAALLIAPGPSLGRRAAELALLAAVASLPVALWLGWVAAETGHLTGIDRFDPTRLEAVREHTSLAGNLELTAKTLWIDLFSGHGYAKARREGYRAGALDVVSLAVLGAAAAAVAAGALRRARARPVEVGDVGPEPLRLDAPVRLCALLCASFFVVLIAVWTVGNNDPINTRFVMPVLPFLLLLGFLLADRAHGRVPRLPVQVAFAWLLATNVLRHLQGLL